MFNKLFAGMATSQAVQAGVNSSKESNKKLEEEGKNKKK